MQDLYKQAILDAKSVRASAIANAKAALQEAFEPQISELVRQSLAEKEEVDEAKDKEQKLGKGPKQGKEVTFVKKAKNQVKEEEDLDEAEDIEEAKDGEQKGGFGPGKNSVYSQKAKSSIKEDEDLDESEDIEEAEEMDETSLDEILAELEGLSSEGLEEDDAAIETDEDESEGMALEADDEDAEEDLGGEEDDLDGEEIPGEEDNEEIVLTFGQLKQALAPFIGGGEEGTEDGEDSLDGEESDIDLDEILGEDEEEMDESKDKEIEEARDTIQELRTTINEVNLLNAKLLYMNKIFKAKNLNESQKQKVVGAFDRAASVKEVKNIFTTLNESIQAPKKQLRESFGFASKPAGMAPKQQITEVDPFIKRMQTLAGIK